MLDANPHKVFELEVGTLQGGLSVVIAICPRCLDRRCCLPLLHYSWIYYYSPRCAAHRASGWAVEGGRYGDVRFYGTICQHARGDHCACFSVSL